MKKILLFCVLLLSFGAVQAIENTEDLPLGPDLIEMAAVAPNFVATASDAVSVNDSNESPAVDVYSMQKIVVAGIIVDPVYLETPKPQVKSTNYINQLPGISQFRYKKQKVPIS